MPARQLDAAATVDHPAMIDTACDCRAGPRGRADPRARSQPARRQAPALQSVRYSPQSAEVAGRLGLLCVFLALCGPITLAAARTATAADVPAATPGTTVTSVAELSWLAGQWRGTTPAGRVIETTYTTPEGGVLLGTSKEYSADGRCVFFDLEHFAMKDGVLTLTPHPAGKRSVHSFPLAAFDRAAHRATFVNRTHDWPQRFVYERAAEDRLIIVLSGPDKKGGERVERFELRLVQ